MEQPLGMEARTARRAWGEVERGSGVSVAASPSNGLCA
jgi:hypothetical protein